MWAAETPTLTSTFTELKSTFIKKINVMNLAGISIVLDFLSYQRTYPTENSNVSLETNHYILKMDYFKSKATNIGFGWVNSQHLPKE